MSLAQDNFAAASAAVTTRHLVAADDPSGRFARDALARDKRESLDLAVRARWAALAVVGAMLPVLNFQWEVLYYEALLLVFALIGWGQRRVGTVGRSRPELLLMFCDIALLTIVCVVPNPFGSSDWPTAMQYRFENFVYFYVLLAGAALAYSWRTMVAMGVWTTGMWTLGVLYVWSRPDNFPELSAAAREAFGTAGPLIEFLDPNAIHFDLRLQEIVVFLIVAFMLALAVRRSDRLLIGHAALERERANLARYFSPNVVEELSQNDEPLKRVRTQDIAVLFVDIFGFTAYAENRSPEDVIGTLRAFHRRMEHEVFRHNGTLDKYLGDGLMATFGTPLSGDSDASNALSCARAMVDAVIAWNAERARAGEPAIRAGFGLHYGPAVLGDIGDNRLEFAVIGSTVNLASRLEALTRELDVAMVASEALLARVRGEPGGVDLGLDDLQRRDGQMIRGLTQPITIWTLA